VTGDGIRPEKRLRITDDGKVYLGEVRLPFCFVNGALRFPVKEHWLRERYGRLVIIRLEDLMALWGVDSDPDM
jgi:hypothetical protein